MDAQSVCWLIAMVLFVVGAFLAYRSWAQHAVLVLLGLAFLTLGFLVPTL